MSFCFQIYTIISFYSFQKMGAEKQRKKKAEGYADGDLTQFHRQSAMQWIESVDYVNLLADASEVLCV
jgi:hypothetical protein